MTKIVNLFAGPGVGKSTIAAALFAKMKMNHLNVEIVQEVAKEYVWGERTNMFPAQDYIFAKQNHRQRILIDKVDWVITDSPIILGHFYITDDFPGRTPFCQFITEMYNSYDNVNIVLNRTQVYQQHGRNHTECEAKQIDSQIITHLNTYNIPYNSIDVGVETVNGVLRYIKGL